MATQSVIKAGDTNSISNTTISTAEVATTINNAINLWLQMAAETKVKKDQETDTVKWLCREDDENRYSSMARAVYDVGRQMGVINFNDYLVFKN